MHIIGIDPHPDSHTAAVLDRQGKLISRGTFRNDVQGLEAFMQWLASFEQGQNQYKGKDDQAEATHRNSTIGVEGAGNPYIRDWVMRWLGEGYTVVNVPPALTSQYRRRKGQRKNDPIDAEQVAWVVRNNPELPRYQTSTALQELKDLTHTHQRLSVDLKSHRMAQQDLPPALRHHLQPVIEALQQALQTLEARMKVLVKEISPVLLDESGIDTILASIILSEVAGVQRFASPDHFAVYCGAAPIDRCSGRHQRVQLNTGHNRRLNRALHLIALTRLKHHPPTRALFEKKLAEGKTKRAALRVLKTVIARSLYRVLLYNQNQVSKQMVRDLKQQLKQHLKEAA